MVVFEFVVGLSFLFLAALCSMQGLSSLTRDQTCAPASGAWSPHHCTSGEDSFFKGKTALEVVTSEHWVSLGAQTVQNPAAV